MTDTYADPDRRQTVVAGPNKLQYVVAVVVMMVLGVGAAVIITVVRPTQDNTVMIGLIFGFLAPTTLSLLTYMKAQETHLSVNSRLDAFLSTAKLAAHAQGITEGRAQGRQSADERTDHLAVGGGAELTATRARLEAYVAENRAAQSATRERLNAMDEARPPAAYRPEDSEIPRVEAPVTVPPKA